MDRASIKQHAKEQIQGKIFSLLAIYLIIFGVSAVIGILVQPVAGIVTFILTGPVVYAKAMIYLGITKKSRMPEVEDLLVGFKDENFLRTLVAYLRVEVFQFLWSLLFVIPGIIKGIAYSQTFYLLAEDQKLDPADAQKKSMEIMEGHKWEYFVLQLSFIPWHLLAFITFGIAYIWVIPYIETTFAEYHVRLVGGNRPVAKTAKVVTAKTTTAKKSSKSAGARGGSRAKNSAKNSGAKSAKSTKK